MNEHLTTFGERVRQLRVHLGWSQEQLAAVTGLHRTYIGSLERGERNVSLLNIIKLAAALQVSPDELLKRATLSASIEANNTDFTVNEAGFVQVPVYSSDGKQSVTVALEGVTPVQYQQLEDVLREGLTRKEPAYNAVAQTMLTAIQLCPDANPADLWVHLIYHTYRELGRSAQSWVRVSGQGFEQVLLDIYAPRLAVYEITLRRSRPDDASTLGLREEGIGGSKTDLVLEGSIEEDKRIFGVIHCKASIAERLSDDAPASGALITHGFWSAVATMDAKMYPPPHGDAVIRGELGHSKGGDKRRYFEVAGQFSGCYSFNKRTLPSEDQTASGARIYALTFTEKQPDVLIRDVLRAWERHQRRL